MNISDDVKAFMLMMILPAAVSVAGLIGFLVSQ
mgnify:CR=1 FL=1